MFRNALDRPLYLPGQSNQVQITPVNLWVPCFSSGAGFERDKILAGSVASASGHIFLYKRRNAFTLMYIIIVKQENSHQHTLCRHSR